MSLLLILLASAQAGDRVALTEVIGWAGSTLLYKGTHDVDFVPPGTQIQDASGYEQDRWELICAQPMRSVTRCWQANNADHPSHIDMPLATPAEWATWKKAHPTTPGIDTLAHRGKTLGLRLEGDEFRGWSNNRSTLHLGYDAEIKAWATVERGGKTWETSLGDREGGGMYSRSVEVSVSWAADGTHLALLENDPGGMHMRGPIPGELKTTVLDATLVTLMAHESLGEEVANQAGWQLHRDAGLRLQRVEPAKKAREATVVYTAKGFEEHGMFACMALIGDCTTEPLSWQSPADLIVALGSSASP